MNIRSLKTAVAVVAAVAALGLTACSSTDSAAEGATTTTPASEFESGKGAGAKEEGDEPPATAAPDLPKPTVEELNTRLTKALAGQLTDEEKLTYIQDADKDPDLVDKFVDAAKKNNVTVAITSVGEPAEGKLKADADVTIDGKPVQDAFVDFVAEDTDWKVSHTFACNVVKSAKLDSAACQA
ncbi:hypothetical protein ACFVVM_00645 [Nocardia sp. NPDC058176]|uniref:hypothetical protein n=1 Tax=Nocardia sp. NPDC058176 TaxID=3346368 RepID=UPI0036DD3F51